MRAIDLFCGAGGLTRGLLNSGIEVIAGVDSEGSLRQTYELNNYPSRFMERDMRTVDPRELADIFGATPPSETVVAGCAPCQTFSKHQRNGRERGPDATLLAAVGRVVDAVNPGWVLVENVPGLMAVPGYSTLRRFVSLLRAKGYSVAQGVLNAAAYGVPQHRRRFVLVASRVAAPALPPVRFGIRHRRHETVRDWIAHFPPISAGTSHPSVPNHVAANLSDVNLTRLRATPPDGGDRGAWPEDLTLECHRARERSFSDVYGRMWWDRVAPTLTARCNSISNGRFGHPDQDRAISLREAASLQTFGDDYVFYGTSTAIARQIGNAVPVRLAEAMGQVVLRG